MITVVQDLVPTSKWHIKCTHPAKFIVATQQMMQV